MAPASMTAAWAGPLPDTFAISTFAANALYNTTPTRRELTLNELADLLTTHERRRNKNGRGWSGATYVDGTTRANENVVEWSVAGADFDHLTMDEYLEVRAGLVQAGLAFVLYSTYNSTAEDFRFRLALPLTHPIPKERYTDAWLRMNAALFLGKNDPQTKDASRMLFLPAVPDDSAPVADYVPGLALDWEALPPAPSVSRATTENGRGDASVGVGHTTMQFLLFGAPDGEQRGAALRAGRSLLAAGFGVADAAEKVWHGLQASPQGDATDPWTYEAALAIVEDLARKPPPPLELRPPRASVGRITVNGAAAHADGVLPEIYADEQDLRVVTGEAWAALEAVNKAEPFLFRQGGALVRVETAEGGKPIFRELALSVIRHEMARAAVWWGMRGPQSAKKRKIVVPPEVVCQDVLATPSPPLPEVIRIAECPVFGPDWVLRTTSGYHASARAYCAIPSDVTIPPISDAPSAEELERAKSLVLRDLLGDFPFEKPADRANAVALFLQPFVRDAINGPTPLHVVESPTVGTGKGLLVDALLRPSCGRGVAVMAQCRDGDEWRKRITAALRAGHAAVQIDNVTLALDSGELAMAITIPYWSDRLLGSSQTVSYPVRCAWALTANNPVLSTEMARRSIRIRLDSKTDRPWERKEFRHKELMGWVDEHRGELIWAGITMIQSWIHAGRPEYTGESLGSFEAWSRVIGGVLEHVGSDGFLGNLAEFYDQADTEGGALRAFTEAWWDHHGRDRVGAAELFPLALSIEGIALGSGNDQSQKAEFGRLLSRQRDRVIGDFTVKHAGKVHGSQKWILMKASDALL